MSSGSGGRGLRATYRLQLTPSFGFADVQGLLHYLDDLGISHVYLSPSLQAKDGSTHGYDVTDPSRLSEALGGDAAFRDLASDAHARGMGIILDVVPNHMAADDENRFWADPELRDRFFDVDPVTGRWRRFFDVDDLGGIRIEREEVFDATQGFTLELVREGVVDGLRVDHPDGLADPVQYLRRLRDGGAERVWVEKILGADERLPSDWPVSGTVGYEFLNDVGGLFVDPAAEPAFTALWERVSGDQRPYGAWELEAKLEQARTTFAPEVERLSRAAMAAEGGSGTGEFAHWSADAIAIALATQPVYRTYVESGGGELITRFQQTAPAIMAKGVEDTTFYRYLRLLALNEVGGDPDRFGFGVDAFHARNAARAVEHPDALVTTMTHDAKRSGDVRMRIAALTQVPAEFSDVLDVWMARTERHVGRDSTGRPAPDDIERYFILQTLVGAWPISADRLQEYFEKALREGKRTTSWVSPDESHEAGVHAFISAVLDDPELIGAIEPFVSLIAGLAEPMILAQLVLKLTVPGIPDVYQGDELGYRALVDPDNRRPVDWEARREALTRLLDDAGGRIPRDIDERKLWTTARLLELRRRLPDAFAAGTGTYAPLPSTPGVCAFVRGDRVLSVVTLPRSATDLDSAVTTLPDGEWHDVLTGRRRSFSSLMTTAELVDPDSGVAVYERL